MSVKTHFEDFSLPPNIVSKGRKKKYPLDEKDYYTYQKYKDILYPDYNLAITIPYNKKRKINGTVEKRSFNKFPDKSSVVDVIEIQ